MMKDEIKAREQADAELDARRAESYKQCQYCHYCTVPRNMDFWYCDFVSWEGTVRDRGEGPGKCGSFRPKKKLTKRERVDRNRQSLIRSELECTDKRFQHGED